MKKAKIFIAACIRSIYTLSKVGIPSINATAEDVIVWAPNYWTIRFWATDNCQKVHATYKTLKKLGYNPTIYTKFNIGIFSNRMVFVFGGAYYNLFGFSDYVNVINHIVNSLESQNNTTLPCYDEILLWENKKYMHMVFQKLQIRTPKSMVVNADKIFNNFDIPYPYLIKELHSCSANGIFKINSEEDAKRLLCSTGFEQRNPEFIIQKLLNIKTDLRVILAGGKIIWFYWRKNTSSDWKPTSTGNGGGVDFENFPEKWRSWILDKFKRLNIAAGAFDIAWDNDDLSTEPYVLEVSPFFQPNPIPKNTKNLKKYGAWKKSVSIFDNYQIAMVDLIFSVQESVVNSYIESYSVKDVDCKPFDQIVR